MPWDIRKKGQEYEVFNQATGESNGVSKTRAKAEAHLRALYANAGPEKTSPGMRFGGTAQFLDDTYTPRPITHGFRDGRRVNAAPAPGRVSAPGKIDRVSVPSGEKLTKLKTGGKVGLPATGDGKTEPGLGAGIAEKENGGSNTNKRNRALSDAPPRDLVNSFIGGGLLKKIVKAPGAARKKVIDKVGDTANRIDNRVFGNEGLGSNVRKLRRELPGYKKGGKFKPFAKKAGKGKGKEAPKTKDKGSLPPWLNK